MAHQGGGDDDAVILAALLDRGEEGMTIFELRNEVHADIDTIEGALERLKVRELIEIDHTGGRVIIRPSDAAKTVVDTGDPDDSVIDRIREWLPF